MLESTHAHMHPHQWTPTDWRHFQFYTEISMKKMTQDQNKKVTCT